MVMAAFSAEREVLKTAIRRTRGVRALRRHVVGHQACSELGQRAHICQMSIGATPQLRVTAQRVFSTPRLRQVRRLTRATSSSPSG